MQTNHQFPFAAVLWDMDGTLIDSEPIWIEEETRLMRGLGVDWSDEDSIHCLGGPAHRVDAYMRARAGDIHNEMELSEILTERMRDRLKSDTRFMPGASELLADLRNGAIPLALVTASTRSIMQAVLDGIGQDHFEVAVSCDDVRRPKPDPEGYLIAAEKIGVAIDSCLVIEDSIPGMTAAIESGAYVLGIPHVVDLPLAARVLHVESLIGHDRASLARLFSGILSS